MLKECLAVTSVALTVVQPCTKLLHLSAQSLVGSPGTLAAASPRLYYRDMRRVPGPPDYLMNRADKKMSNFTKIEKYLCFELCGCGA